MAKEMEIVPLNDPMRDKEKHQVGTCPGCGASYEIEEEQHFSYPGLSVNWECPNPDCGMTGSEDYEMKFLAHGCLMRPKK